MPCPLDICVPRLSGVCMANHRLLIKRPVPLRGLRLLLAEHNSASQKLAIRLLEEMGRRVTLAANG